MYYLTLLSLPLSLTAAADTTVVEFRQDPTRTLVAANATFAAVRQATTIHRDEFEAIYQDRVELWATPQHREALSAAGIATAATPDLSQLHYEIAKKRDYMDPAKPNEPAWDEYCGYNCLTARLAEMAAQGGCLFPFELDVAGKTGQGRDIWVVRVGARGPNVLMAGNIHGDETTGGQLLQRWLWETCNQPSNAQTQVASSVVAYYMPLFNADGYEMNQRGNARGIDLNRDFPAVTGGSASQPETLAYTNFHQQHDFDVGIMFHGGAVVCNYAYDNCYTSNVVPRPCPPASTEFHARHADVLPSSKAYCDPLVSSGVRCTVGTGCQVNGAVWYQISGSAQDWEFHFQGTAAMTMEVSSQKRPSGSALPGFYTQQADSIAQFMMYPVKNGRSDRRSNATSL